MKRLLAVVMLLALAVGFAACGGTDAPQSTPAPTEPSTGVTTVPTEETTVPTTQPGPDMVLGGVDLSGLSVEQAAQALNEVAAAYTLNLTVNGTRLTIGAAELGLSLDEAALGVYLDALGAGEEPAAAVFTYNSEALLSLLGDRLNKAPENVSISYNSSKKQFVASGGAEGTEYDLAAAEAAAAAAIGLLESAAEVQVGTTKVAPAYSAGSEQVKSALQKANGYLAVSLTYSYTPEGGETAKESLGAATIASFVSVSDEWKVSISKSAIESYAGQMADRHNGADYKDKFKTTNGGTISTEVTYYGQKVNTSALADDIYKCVTEQKSGTRTAPYRSKSDKPYGGSYVEIDLSAQKLWLYKNGERLLTTKLVSGSVAEKCCTPTGVYSIYSKQTDRYLTGADYRSFVHYWMPFLGGYGLHDASWRSSFGGDIYLYDGSHGCVNLPSSAAKKIYNNVSVGTKVILYGGKREVPDLEQKLTGTTAYEVTADAAPFKLDVKAKYSGATLHYASSDTRVVQVSSNGTVTVIGEGTAVITVDASPFEFYTGAELKITVKVGPAKATEPTDPPTEPTDPPTEPTDPPTQPTDPPTEPTDPPTEPTDPPTEPTDPPTKPTDPPTEPTDPPTEPTDPPTEPTDPPTEPTDPPVESTPAE